MNAPTTTGEFSTKQLKTEGRRTPDEQKLQTALQTGATVPFLLQAKPLIYLVGAPGLEPGTR
jgi:hypothetical protein